MSNELYHHGILGQKWGVRLYQNKDGSLTPLGRRRYLKGIEDKSKRSIVELASIGARAKKEAEQPKKSTTLFENDYAGSASNILAYMHNTRKELSDLADAQVEHRKAMKEYMRSYKAGIKELYSDRDRFKEIAKRYADKVMREEGVTDETDKEHYYAHFVNGDGFQDAAEQWYVDEVLKLDKTKLRAAAEKKQAATEKYVNKVLDTEVDKPMREAVIELTGTNANVLELAKNAITESLTKEGAESLYDFMSEVEYDREYSQRDRGMRWENRGRRNG